MLRMAVVGRLLSEQTRVVEHGRKYAISYAFMYPTSIINTIEAGLLRDKIDKEDVEYANME